MPLCRTMYGVTGNVRVRLCEGTKVAAVSEGISGRCSILYTGASGNKCGLSLEQRRASFVGIKNRQNKGLQSCNIVQHHLPGGLCHTRQLGFGVGIWCASNGCVRRGRQYGNASRFGCPVSKCDE